MAQNHPSTKEVVEQLRKDVDLLKHLVTGLRESIGNLDTEKDNLRQAVRKLKAENARTKEKVKRLATSLKAQIGDTASDNDDFPEYDEIGRDYILVGGSKDPLGIRFEASFKDADGIEHKTVERYYWAKMAKHFNDSEAMAKIIEAPNTIKAEEAVKEIKNLDDKAWGPFKISTWEEGQKMKFDQHKWIANILIETGSSYIAVCHQDKQLGTGWRKNREESNKPLFWDGKNLGGLYLMRLRKTLSKAAITEEESEDAKQKIEDLRRFVWRRLDRNNRGGQQPVRGASRYRGSRNFGNRQGNHPADKRPNPNDSGKS